VYHIGDFKLLGFEYDELLCVSRRTPSRKRHRPQVRGSKYRLCRLTRHWKRKHRSAESAEVARGEMQRKYPQYDYRAYACRCGAWHVGRDVRKAREERKMSVEETTRMNPAEFAGNFRAASNGYALRGVVPSDWDQEVAVVGLIGLQSLENIREERTLHVNLCTARMWELFAGDEWVPPATPAEIAAIATALGCPVERLTVSREELDRRLQGLETAIKDIRECLPSAEWVNLVDIVIERLNL
jgi:hypothetical protein